MRRVDIASDVETISNVTNQRAFVNRAIQNALDRVYQFYDFPYYLQEGVVRTVIDYNTGTTKVTQNSTAVTGVSTVFTSAMVGRKFRHSTENPYYKISAFGSATALTLQDPYQGSTDSTGSSYEIFKDEYRLAADVDKFKTFRQMQNRVPLYSLPITQFDEMYPSPSSLADPVYAMLIGTKLDTYTTGTLSGSGSTLTGSSTVWTGVEGLGRFSKIRIGNNVYTIKTVDSDTQITIYETMSSSVSAGTSYVITLDNIVIQFYNIPNANRLLYYRYFRLPTPLSNDYDEPDMPKEWHYILAYSALSDVLSQKGDVNKAYSLYETKFINALNQMKLKVGSFAPDMIYKRKSTDRIPRLLDGLEKADYDRRFSMP